MAKSPPLPSLLEGNSRSLSAEKSLEYGVFVKFYSKLTIVFRNKDYLPYLVTAGIVPPDNIHYLSSLSNRDRPMRILEYISDSLDGGDKQSFYEMLEIMKDHGNNHAQNLAEEINKAVVSGVDLAVPSFGSVGSTRSNSIGSVRSDSLKSESIRSNSIGSTATSIDEGIAVYIKDKSSLTTKLFEILLDKHMSIEVNAELLSYFKEFKDLDEYQSVVGSVEDPVSRTISLKKLVFRLYRDHRLKDLDFLKYLVWSGQGHLCKLIGYGDKQIEKMMKDKDYQKLSLRLIRDDDDTGNDTVVFQKKIQILQSLSKARGCLLKVRYGKVLICGAGAAGKTNFLNLLMKDKFQSVHISTEVARKIQVSINDENKKVVFRKMDIDSEIKQLRLHLPPEYTKRSKSIQDYSEPDLQRKSTIAEDMICSAVAEDTDSKDTDSGVTDSEEEETLPSKKVWDILTFMDTGGQPQFISMLPAVNNFAMITFIVHKITESLTDNVVAKHRNKIGKDSCEPYTCEYTHHQLIQTLMSYASCVLLPEKEFLNNYKESILENYDKSKATSSISFIGTHSSCVTENKIKKIDEELTKTVRNSKIFNIKPSVNSNYRYLVPLDNQKQEKDIMKADTDNKIYTDPSSIREYIHKWLRKQDVYNVPIQWLLLELEIRKVCIDRNCSFITYDEVLKISRDKDLGDEEFVRDGLRFHHLFGVLLYFEEVKEMRGLIITDHQWLFNKLTDIVVYSKSIKNNYDYDTSTDLDDCKKRGIFRETMLDKLHISTDFEKSGLNKQIFLKLLQYLRIIASLNEDPTQYFMPSLLSSYDLTNVQKKIPGENTFIIDTEVLNSEPLLIQFRSPNNTNSFPRGFFCFLVVQLIHSTEWELYGQAYDNFLCFIKKNTAHYITLIDRIFFLEVQLTHKSGNCSPVHDKIFVIIFDALVKVRSRLDVGIEPDYGFWCKECEEPHISLVEEDFEYCYCSDMKATKLQRSHKIWLRLSKSLSTKQGDHHKGPANITIDSVGFSQNEILQQEPIMGDLLEFVVPQIKAHWKNVAYIALRYDIPTVKGIQKKHLNDVEMCCQEMFEIWLTTSHGIKPKTWSTLLAQLKKVEELVAVTEVIEKRLKK